MSLLFPARQRFPHSRQPDRPLLPILRRYWRRVLVVILCLHLFVLYSKRKHPFTQHAHQINFSSSMPAAILGLSQDGLMPLDKATKFCAQYNWRPYPDRSKRRKVYDMIMLNTELDWLEIRLQTMQSEVDYFVIMESKYTFTGIQKPLMLTEALRSTRFMAWKEKIIYVVVEGVPIDAPRTWDLEDHQRNAMLLQGLMPIVNGPQRPEEGDVLIVADVDEIVRPFTLLVLRECDIPNRVTLRSKFYYYGFQWLHNGEEWPHPQATVYRGANTILPNDLRNGEGGNRLKGWWDKADLWNAGWHCSSCFATVDDMLNKMKSFSHTSMNKEEYTDKKRMVDRIRKGLDLWDRPQETFMRIENNEDIPHFLKDADAKSRFGYLLNRDGPSAGFTDYKEGD